MLLVRSGAGAGEVAGLLGGLAVGELGVTSTASGRGLDTTSTVAFPAGVVVRRTWVTWVALAKVIQAGAVTSLMVCRTRRSCPVATAECSLTSRQGSRFEGACSVGWLALMVNT
jgi:hypothetical protein